MKCPRCQQENPPQAKFCLECAAPLARACANCGAQLSGTAKFCSECAHPAGPAAPPPSQRFGAPEAYTPKHLAERIINSKAALEGERKQVTVLFADLKGSMELLADRDPEEARKILDPVLELMMEAVHRYEGTVNQVMGDGIMALFGAPVAHEDHAVRACYAALRMQDSVRRSSENVRREEGVPIRIRVGLNSGEVVVRAIGSDLHMDYTAVGQTTHLAARMEQLAAPGTINLTAATLALAEGFVEVKSLGTMPVKGLGEPVDVYELTGASPVRSRLQATVLRGLTRFVGRDVEIDHLRRALSQAEAGHAQVVAIVGEAGVGKSRLTYEFTHSHRVQDWLILEASSVSYGRATSYLPVIDLLKGYFKIGDRDNHREMRDKVMGRVLGLDRALEPLLPPLLGLLDVPAEDATWQALDAPQRRQRTLAAVKRLLLRESQVQPLLVVFEDLHWIDGETQALLDSLVDSLGSARLLLLVNYRPEYQHGWGSKSCYTQLRLDALARESAAELLVALLGTDDTVEPLKPLLIARTGGNPFFLEESVRTLVETKTLTGERGAYRLARPLQTLDVPATVQAILASRIDRLSPDDKQLLQTASVIGKDVPFALLLAIAGLIDDELRRGLARLQDAEFLYETRLFPELEHTFKHALTHEVAYGGLLHERRRALHARVVATLEDLRSDRLPEDFELLVHHAYRGEQWEKTVRYARLAGDEAAARSAHRQVIELCQQAVNALEHMADTEWTRREEVEIRHAMRNAHLALGDLDAIPANLHRALTLAEALDDSQLRSRITSSLAHYHWLRRELPQAFPLAHRGIELAERAGDVVEVAVARGVLGRAHWARGEYDAAVTVFRKCLEIEPSEPPRVMTAIIAIPSVVSKRWLAQSLAELGSFEAAIAAGREALHTAETRNHPYSLANALSGLGIVMFRRGEFVEAASLLEHACEVAREFGFREFMGPSLPFLATAYAAAGRWTDASAVLNAARESIGSVLHYHARIGEAALAVGALPQARQYSEVGLEFSRKQTARGDEAWSLYLLGAITADEESGSVAVSQGYYRQGLALAEELSMRPLVAHCHLGLGKLYRRTDKREQAREHLATATTMYREMDMRFWLEKAEVEVRGLA
jgi:class 3 adenylate cyclase/tetratricopeptide (TPR) repeat protein